MIQMTADLELEGARAITTFKSGTDTYVAVAARDDDGVQILNVTDPTDIAPTASITDGGTLELKGANGIATFKSGTGTYVAVAALTDKGVQILNVTDPTDITCPLATLKMVAPWSFWVHPESPHSN